MLLLASRHVNSEHMNAVLSALEILSAICNKSLIYDIKDKGPSIVPWGKPMVTLEFIILLA